MKKLSSQAENGNKMEGGEKSTCGKGAGNPRKQACAGRRANYDLFSILGRG